MLQNTKTIQPKVVVIRRRPNQGFGFTLRHFIAYPPEDDSTWPQEASDPYQVKAMETIFIKEVQPNGPAHYANLQTGDRVLMVNNTPIAGIAYSTIVTMIKQTPSVLTLHVVPKECDVLQMHYTSIAHTPESNRLAALPKPISSPITVGNGNAGAGALIAIPASSAKSYSQQSQQQQLISYPPIGHGSRSGSITSATSNSLRPLTGGGSIDFPDMSTQSLHHGTLLMRGDATGFMRSQQPNLTVLARHQQQQQQHHQLQNSSIYAATSNSIDTSDLMIRLRESIKQKEEFLKSPLPHAYHHQQQQQQHQHFFPHTPPSGSPQLSMVSTSTTSAGSSAQGNIGARGQVRTLVVKQPLSASSSSGSSGTKDLLPITNASSNCDTQAYYTRNNLPNSYTGIHDSMIHRNGANSSASGNGNGGAGVHGEIVKTTHTYTSATRTQRQGGSNSGSGLRDKYSKELDYLETLQETGVTNKVFERKLVSHIAKGFDPFKPLSINTSALEPSASTGSAALMKKPGVLYESLQHHPLHQLQLQQLQQTQPKVHQGHAVVDGQQSSRMEVHKATVATAVEHTPSKYTSKSTELEEKTTLTNIAESNDSQNQIPKTSDCGGVVRRFKPASCFDDNKPMRRISYLRATNNENEFPSEGSSVSTTVNSMSAPAVASVGDSGTVPNIEEAKHYIEEDPTYDEVGGVECEIPESPISPEVEPKPMSSYSSVLLNGSRRTSLSNEIRNSVHIENLTDFLGKAEVKDVATEMEIFETEMEIKAACIHGKRVSEYRSWRNVKIEIKGDILRIYPSRSSKSENNVIELNIRNFKIFDESVDKKKYIFRIQSKPSQLATLGNELNIEDSIDKLTSSGSSTSTTMATQLDQHTQTDILFKTKSLTEMKRIFGLLQWKNSLIFDDSDLQGKQLAEPQKKAATVSMPTATYCDDNVQQQQQLQPDYSSLSSTSRGDLEGGDSISPMMKARKSSSSKNIPDKDLGSPKAKNWKDLLFRRGGGSQSADISPSNLASTSRTIGSIGVPLKTCPMSKNNEYVPNIVEVCTNIVETKGLGVVGIYRIPGNKAAISELSEQVNKSDFSWDRCSTDIRWEDVNVVSSLLKLFIRSLPDALLPSSFYNHFIEVDKKSGLVRLKELKDLLESLPRCSYETMKHLIRHLHRVSKNCDVNLMDPKNLAIIFGPSIIRTPNDTLEIAVKDMKHQCRIVELLVTQYDYFFENGSTPDVADICGNNLTTAPTGSAAAAMVQSQENQTNMLLHNVSKIERFNERETTRTSRFIPQLRRRTHSKRSAVSSDTYSGESVLSLDYTKSTLTTSSCSSTNATTASSSSSSSTNTTAITVNKKKERGFLGHGARSHHRKASLDEKDSGSGSGVSMSKEQQRSSVDISILLTDDESSNSRNSDTGSMSLTTITDTLDSKLRNLRSGSESNDENGSPEFPKNRRHTFGQPLHLHSENIPYADESPERHFHNPCALDAPNMLMLSRSCMTTNAMGLKSSGEREKEKGGPGTVSGGCGVSIGSRLPTTSYKANKLQHSATAPINSSIDSNGGSGVTSPTSMASTPTAVVTVKTTSGGGSGRGSARNSYTGKNLRFSSSVYEQCCSDDDSEGSTTSDPKEALVIASPSFFLDRYNKKRRDHRLFRSASFNCRNYSTRHGSSIGGAHLAGLTKDEKTDMNLTKKRQIQNKQNRSIKRRHTVGGPHDYSSNGTIIISSGGNGATCTHHCKNGGNNGSAIGGSSTTTTTTVLRRIPIPSHSNGNITNNNNNNNGAQQSGNSSNGNGDVGGSGATTVSVAGAGEHVLEVGIRIKNINRSRY